MGQSLGRSLAGRHDTLPPFADEIYHWKKSIDDDLVSMKRNSISPEISEQDASDNKAQTAP